MESISDGMRVEPNHAYVVPPNAGLMIIEDKPSVTPPTEKVASTHRDLLVNMTFGVVLISILGQGLTMAPLLRRLGIGGGGHDRGLYERRRAAALAARAALAAVDSVAHEQVAPAEVVARLRAEYETRLGAAEEAVEELHLERGELRAETERAMRRSLLLVEKDALLRAERCGLVGHDALGPAVADVDARLFRAEAPHEG